VVSPQAANSQALRAGDQASEAGVIVVLVAALALSFPVAEWAGADVSRQQKADQPKEVDGWTSLADGVQARVVPAAGNAVSNAGFVVLDHGVVVFDAHFSRDAGDALLARIRSTTPKPVLYLVSSHFHPDHTQGMQSFPSGVQTLSSTNTRRDLLQKNLPVLNRGIAALQSQLEGLRKAMAAAQVPEQKETLRSQIAAREQQLQRLSALKVTAPALTTDDSFEMTDGRTIRVFSPGPGHTEGDLVLYLPDSKILFAGDLFFNGSLPNTQDAKVLQWMNTITELLKIDAEKVVPGHGAVGGKSDLRRFLAYFEELKAKIEPAVVRGDPLEQVLRDVQIPDMARGWEFQNFFPGNVQRMYSELKAALPPPEPSKPPDKPKP
jgi:cyclase